MSEARLEFKMLKIRDIVAEYRSGRLVIPEFQRDYVWKPSRAPVLLDSLYRRWPISSLLVWRNEGEQVEARRLEPRPGHGATSWLIDGQQRVITLYKLVQGDEGIEVVFNGEGEHAIFQRPNAATKQDRAWISVHQLWDAEGFRRLQRDCPDTASGRRLAERYEHVRAILEYEVPIVEMIDHRFDEAVDAFKRINTYGVKLRKQDIESAAVAAKHSGFIRNNVAPFLRQLRDDGFDRLNVMHLFRVCAVVAHPDGRRRTPLHELDESEVKEAWKTTTRATKEALGILRSELGLVDMSILRSGSLLVPVIAICARTPPRERKPRELAGWMALAALHHRYSGSVETTLDEDLKACRADDPIGSLLRTLRGAGNGSRSLRANPAHFSGTLVDRSALFAAWVACKHRAVRDVLTGGNLVLQKGIDRHHLLPRARFELKNRIESDVIGNIAFISGASNKSINDDDPAKYLSEVKKDVLESQCVPLQKTLWDVRKADRFWERRRTLLAQSFNEFLERQFPGRRL
jgi:hypothetical protein